MRIFIQIPENFIIIISR